MAMINICLVSEFVNKTHHIPTTLEKLYIKCKGSRFSMNGKTLKLSLNQTC